MVQFSFQECWHLLHYEKTTWTYSFRSSQNRKKKHINHPNHLENRPSAFRLLWTLISTHSCSSSPLSSATSPLSSSLLLSYPLHHTPTAHSSSFWNILYSYGFVSSIDSSSSLGDFGKFGHFDYPGNTFWNQDGLFYGRWCYVFSIATLQPKDSDSSHWMVIITKSTDFGCLLISVFYKLSDCCSSLLL